MLNQLLVGNRPQKGVTNMGTITLTVLLLALASLPSTFSFILRLLPLVSDRCNKRYLLMKEAEGRVNHQRPRPGAGGSVGK